MSICKCWTCLRERARTGPRPQELDWMILCEKCGNKRCPHATDHNLACTSSNEPDQEGSRYSKNFHKKEDGA